MTRNEYINWVLAVRLHRTKQGDTVSTGELQEQEDGKFLTKIFINGQKFYAGYDGFGYSVWN